MYYIIFFIRVHSIPFHSMLEKICSPALLYLAFSMVQITVDLFQGQYQTSLLKFIIMIIFTAVLNILCMNGYTKFVWFIVIIPILMLTYISSILFYIFGIHPGKDTVNVQKKQRGGNRMRNGPGQGQQAPLPAPISSRGPAPAPGPTQAPTPYVPPASSSTPAPSAPVPPASSTAPAGTAPSTAPSR